MAGILIIVLGLSILGPGNMELLAYERNLLCTEVLYPLLTESKIGLVWKRYFGGHFGMGLVLFG